VKMHVKNGVPSGSIWTSLLDSVVNYMIVDEVVRDMSITDYTIKVYGDDHLIAFNCDEIQAKHFKRLFQRRAYRFFLA